MAVSPDLGPDPDGATPLDVSDLLLGWVQTRAVLNQVEQDGILRARVWAFGLGGRRPVTAPAELLTESFCDELHRRMFDGIWGWAGRRRKEHTSIGVDPALITVAYRDALADAQFWHDEAVFTPAELAVRIHHRIVSVHPYTNGNGRHSRLVADLYLDLVGAPALSWGGVDLAAAGALRDRYIAAVRAATPVDVSALLEFATAA